MNYTRIIRYLRLPGTSFPLRFPVNPTPTSFFASNSIFPSLRFSITIRYASKKEKRKLDRDATSISIDKAPIDNFLYFFGEIKNYIEIKK